MKGAVSVDAETQCQLDVKGHAESSTKTEEEGKEGSKVHNAIQCNIDFDDEHDIEIAPGDVAVTSNLKNRVDLNGTFGLVRVHVPSKQRWCVRCAGQVLDVAIAAKNLVRVTAKELGGNLRYMLSNIEYAEVCAVLAFLSRHLEFAGGTAKAAHRETARGSEGLPTQGQHQEKDSR